MKYNKLWLEAKLAQEKRVKYLPFWGHKASLDGTITASCLSQWWEGHSFREAGILYTTAEHYMMAGKAKLFNDQANLSKILQAKSPAEAKKWGRTVQNFDFEVWNNQRAEIVIAANLLKFSQHDELGHFLLNTKDRVLVEASPVDQIWGIGLAKDDPRVTKPSAWKGKNLLGFCLMEVRDRLRNHAPRNMD